MTVQTALPMCTFQSLHQKTTNREFLFRVVCSRTLIPITTRTFAKVTARNVGFGLFCRTFTVRKGCRLLALMRPLSVASGCSARISIHPFTPRRRGVLSEALSNKRFLFRCDERKLIRHKQRHDFDDGTFDDVEHGAQIVMQGVGGIEWVVRYGVSESLGTVEKYIFTSSNRLKVLKKPTLCVSFIIAGGSRKCTGLYTGRGYAHRLFRIGRPLRGGVLFLFC
mmetsp:Transcript_39321/g.54814  ORF Transcript_39321/g.54814 Transcript_39321/m.54814 type:complete len:223 (-) Transcript_39321:43-711(-)